MPKADLPSRWLPRALRRALHPTGVSIKRAAALAARRRRPKDGSGAGGLPVDPNRPNLLSGGAAARLEFGDE
jgi:hypothetical protein